MASFPLMMSDSKGSGQATTSSSPSTSSAFSIDTILSSNLQQFSSNFSPESFTTFPWTMQYPFISMLCSPFMPQFIPPYHQHFVNRRKRRHRTIFSEEQLAILETTFLATHYPDVATREKLAIQCSLKEERVEVWFKNRRAKERKQKKDDNRNLKLSDDSECDESDEELKRTCPKKAKKEEASDSSPTSSTTTTTKSIKDASSSPETKTTC